MLKDFLMKKALERQLKSLPDEQRTMLMGAIEKNPKLFERIAKEIQEQIKAGSNQMAASVRVMKKYQKELRDAMMQ